MREILFRGERVKTGNWVEGFYRRDNELEGTVHLICTDWDDEFIDPNTLGQYIGLKDHNDVRIFEGDILQNFTTKKCYKVKWCQNTCRFHCIDTERNTAYVLDRVIAEHSVVVGNIYDKQEE